MRPGWNPTRRNKHAGTKAHGHGDDNDMVIPESWHDPKCYSEKLSSYVIVRRNVGARDLNFFVEPTRPDWFYPCTVDDICAVLSHCSAEVLSAFDFVVLRQPTRKQRILSPVWGRAMFTFDLNQHTGAAIVIEAQDLGSIVWPRSINPERARELKRLRGDGHEVRNTRRGLEIQPTCFSLRNTVLYRTLLHELGHHVDYKRSTQEEWSCKCRSEKEDFAHRYALDMYAQLSKQDLVPFAPIVDDELLFQDKLKREWFCSAPETEARKNPRSL